MVSARGPAVEDRLRGNFVRGELGLKVGATLIERGDHDKNDGRSKHQPSEKSKVLIGAELVRWACAEDPFINQTDEEFTRGHAKKPQRHDRAFHRVRRL